MKTDLQQRRNKRKRVDDDRKSAAATPSVEESRTAGHGEKDGKTTKKGRDFTVSIALPGSFVDNAQSRELRTYLVGQIARAATVFSIDEVVVFDDKSTATETAGGKRK